LAWGIVAAAALVAAQAPLHAQDAEAPANDTGTVGPRELEDFSINGTVTQPAPQRPAPTPPATRPQPTAQPPATGTRPPATATPTDSSAAPERPTRTEEAARPAPSREAEPLRQTAPSSSVTVALPGLDSQGEASATARDIPVPNVSADDGLPLWPWLLAALAAAGAGFYFYRERLQPALAGGVGEHAFEAPAPAPPPAPAAPRTLAPRHDPTPKTPAPKTPAPAAEDPFKGFVSTRLRPWIELGFDASRCTIENDKVTIDFEIEMVNSGNAPARGVLVEARLVNAGPGQDSEIGQFFAHPVGQGERIDSIAPLKNVRIKSRIVTPLSNVQVLDVAGRKVFVPLIAFNILYGWARGTGQTSASYLVGRDTKGEKMAPFRLDLGPRLFRSLAQAPLPIAVRQ